MKPIDYTISLRKDSPSAVGGLDALGPVLVNCYPRPSTPPPYELATLAEFEALPATPEALDRRAKIYALQNSLLRDVPGASTGPEPEHMFLPGVYVRTLTMQPGWVIVSKRHAREHIVIVSKGRATVYTEDGVTEVKAPYRFASPAGSKRVLFVHEESVWTTVHPAYSGCQTEIEAELMIQEVAA